MRLLWGLAWGHLDSCPHCQHGYPPPQMIAVFLAPFAVTFFDGFVAFLGAIVVVPKKIPNKMKNNQEEKWGRRNANHDR